MSPFIHSNNHAFNEKTNYFYSTAYENLKYLIPLDVAIYYKYFFFFFAPLCSVYGLSFYHPTSTRIHHISLGYLPAVTGTFHVEAVNLADGNMYGHLVDLPAPFHFPKKKKKKFLLLYIYLITLQRSSVLIVNLICLDKKMRLIFEISAFK